jgi:hypothetical protein
MDIWVDGGSAYLIPIRAKDSDFMSSQKEGTPERFWLEFGEKGTEIHLFPKAERELNLNIRYCSDQKACDSEGTPKNTLTEMDDTLNIPADTALEELYLHCLYTKSMEYLIADTNDENYLPYQKEFTEAYRMLLKYTGSKITTRLCI